MAKYYRDITVQCRVYFDDDESGLCLEDQASQNLENGDLRFDAMKFEAGETEVAGYSPAGPVCHVFSDRPVTEG